MERVVKSKGYRVRYITMQIFFVLLGLIMVFPVYNVIVTSFATQQDILNNPLMLFPEHPTLSSYRYLVLDGGILKAYGVTIVTTVVGTVLSMTFTTLLAYALSKRELPGCKFFHRLLVASMFVDSGLIPFYLLVRNLHLTNTIWSSIIPGLISVWNYMVMRSFFLGFPIELEESAKLDGASVTCILRKIVLPLSKPTIATFTLYYAVDYWNTWYNCMLFNNKESLQTLQLYVYRFVQRASLEFNTTAAAFRDLYGEGTMNEAGIRAATCTAAVVPILCLYPFLMKYFEKGAMLGAVKG